MSAARCVVRASVPATSSVPSAEPRSSIHLTEIATGDCGTGPAACSVYRHGTYVFPGALTQARVIPSPVARNLVVRELRQQATRFLVQVPRVGTHSVSQRSEGHTLPVGHIRCVSSVTPPSGTSVTEEGGAVDGHDPGHRSQSRSGSGSACHRRCRRRPDRALEIHP